MKKAMLGTFILLFVFANMVMGVNVKAESELTIIGEYGVAIDAKTGEILYNKRAEEKASPASMTKVLTALLIAEKMEAGEKMNVTEQSIATECSCYGVEEGETLTKEDAIHALMIKSANDVSVAAAEHIAGSVEEFAELMNERAKQIGVSNQTNFVTPSGLDHPDHMVTAYDMALIVREAVKNQDVLQAMQAKEYTVESNKKTLTLTRQDKVSTIEHAVGGKTGFTSIAGNTLTVYFKDGEKEMITVVMASNNPNHYTDSSIMADYANKQLEVFTVFKKNQVVEKIKVGNEMVSLRANEDFLITRVKGRDAAYNIKTKLNAKENVVKAGSPLGVAEVFEGEKQIGSFTLMANEEVLFKQPKEETEKEVAKSSLSIWWAFFVPLGIYIAYLFYNNSGKRKKIKANY